MTTIDLFYQGEGIGEIGFIEIEAETMFAVFKTRIVEKHGVPSGTLLFLEDEEEPLDETIVISERVTGHAKVHLHRCRHVETTVTFNGETVERRFSPSATVARVKRWAAEEKFGMSAEEAGEHVLQIAGKHDRPAPGTHIGALTDGKVCGLAFDLMPDERVNGALGQGA